jgi:hypothetical protein
MKTKKFSKKLTLSKTTITNLDHKEQSHLRGGYWPTELWGPYVNCNTWHPHCETKPIELCFLTDGCSEEVRC